MFSMHLGCEKCTQNMGQKNLKGSNHFKDIGIDEILLKWIFKKLVVKF
jgi:hypothetical protein